VFGRLGGGEKSLDESRREKPRKLRLNYPHEYPGKSKKPSEEDEKLGGLLEGTKGGCTSHSKKLENHRTTKPEEGGRKGEMKA